MVDQLLAWLAGVPLEWRVFFLAMLPVTELRLTIPLALGLGMSPGPAFFWSLAGNLVPVLPILLLLPLGLRWLGRLGPGRRLQGLLASRGRAREAQVRRWGFWGLVLFVGVPLPGTGAWTGSLVAALLGLPLWRSFTAVLLGLVLAGVLVSAASLGLWELWRWLGPLAVALVVAALVLLWLWYRRPKA